MKSVKILSLLLAAIMTVAAFVSCNNGKMPGKESSGGEDTNQTDEIITSVKPQDYNGTEFNFLTIADQERFHKEIFVEAEDTQEVIYASVYRRNDYVNNYLNIVINTTPSDTAYDTATTLINSSDTTYDVYNLYKHGCISLITQGYTRDWSELNNINFENPWWNSSAFENLAVNGKIFLMSGSILITEIDDTLAMVYNKDIYNEYSSVLEYDIFDEVLGGTWTLDRFISMVTKVSADLNADGEINVGDDLLGYATEPNSMAMNWPFACNFVHGTIKDGEYDMNVTSSTINNVTTMLEKLKNLFASDYADQSKQLDECVQMFTEGKSFITAIILRNLESMRDMESDYGVIPYPKFDENQKDYITHVGGASPIMVIPSQNTSDDERLGNILEAMCEASYRITRPAYYETALKEKGTRDEESKQILDLILDSRTYDLAYISASGLAWMIGGMIAAENDAFARQWQKQGERVQATLQDLVDSIIENNAY